MLLVVSVVIDTERSAPLAVYCNGHRVWPRVDWLAAAPCRGLDPSSFVPDLTDTRLVRAELADPPPVVGLLCSSCPYHRDCFTLGRLSASSGWWGGTLIHDGKPVTANGHVRERPVEQPWKQRNHETRNAKVTWDDVHEIRRRYDAGGVTQGALGVEYGLTLESVNRIVNRRSWKDPPKLSAADAETIRRRVAAGVTHRALADEYDVSQWTIHEIAGDELKRRPKLSLADEEEIRRRYAAGGVIHRQLAREYGVDKSTISHVIKPRKRPDTAGELRKLRS